MKKSVFLLAIILWVVTALAQQNELWVGLLAGPQRGDIAKTSLLTEFVDKPGFQAGGALRYKLRSEFALQLELLYEKRSFATRTNLLGLRPGEDFDEVCWDCYFRSRVDYTSHYLLMPITGGYERSHLKFAFQAYAGLFAGLLMKNQRNGFEELYLDPEAMTHISKPLMEPGLYRTVYSGASQQVINTYDAGLILGIGLSYNLNPNTIIGINGRTQIGFAGIYENPNMPMVTYKSFSFKLGLWQKLSSK